MNEIQRVIEIKKMMRGKKRIISQVKEKNRDGG
jgi:hypothetical protein